MMNPMIPMILILKNIDFKKKENIDIKNDESDE